MRLPRIALWIAVCLPSLTVAGCATRVAPPSQLANPVTVYIADYGHHASLVLPREQPGVWGEFAYGEWGWIALGQQGWYRALPIMTLTSPGTLGTRDIHVYAEGAGLESGLLIENLHALSVERAAAAALLAEFDAHFAANAAHEVYNPDLDMRFVPYPTRYSLIWQCNSMLANWLRRLGCGVSRPAILSDFDVSAPTHTEGVQISAM